MAGSWTKRIVLGLALFCGARAHAAAETSIDDGNRQWISQAGVAQERIWAVVDEALLSYALDGSDAQTLIPQGVIDLDTHGGDAWALRYFDNGGVRPATFSALHWTGAAFEASPTLTMLWGDWPIALVADDGAPMVVAPHNLYRLDGHVWRAKPLSAELGWSEHAVHVLAGGRLYLGFDNGEWGGGLRSIDLTSGRVEEIENYDPVTPCSGPLYSQCTPITSLIADAERPGCVLAAAGLVHFLSHGAVLSVCGANAKVVLEREFGSDADDDESKIRMSEAFYGLAPADDGYWAITPWDLYHVRPGGRLARVPLVLRQSNGLVMQRPVPELLVLQTDIRARVSLSGATPLVVPVPASH